MTPRNGRSLHIPGVAHASAPIPMGARVGNLIFSSAIMGRDAVDDSLPPDADAQARLAFSNLEAVLRAGSANLAHVGQLTVYVKDNSVREAVNREWVRRFPDPNDRPARHIVVHALQGAMLLQLQAIAVVPETA